MTKFCMTGLWCLAVAASACKANHGGQVLSTAPEAHTAGHDIYADQEAWSGACKGGLEASSPEQRQSPIALDPTLFAGRQAGGISLNYGEAEAKLINNGHTIQVAFPASKQTLTFEGREYTLQQFHFHRQSEHVVVTSAPAAERRYGMEVHFVHTRKPDGPDDRNVAVALGFFVEEGDENVELERLWSKVPEGLGSDELTPIGVGRVIPRGAEYLVYQGSLTTPPCDEYVTHAVSTTPMTMSAEQMGRFARLYARNNRVLQPVGDAGIRQFRVASETPSGL